MQTLTTETAETTDNVAVNAETNNAAVRHQLAKVSAQEMLTIIIALFINRPFGPK